MSYELFVGNCIFFFFLKEVAIVINYKDIKVKGLNIMYCSLYFGGI